MKSESTERKPLVILGELRGRVEEAIRYRRAPTSSAEALLAELEQAITREQLETSLVLQKAIREAGR